jgi:putative tryptophan/tyrosine transport system substrate-binding protein
MSLLSRRQFVQGAGVAGLGMLAGCGRWPGQAAPQSARVHRLGVISGISVSGQEDRLDMLRRGLHEYGYIEGHNLVLEVRNAGGNPEVVPALVAELVQIPVDVIVAAGTPAIAAAKNATATIPIIFPVSGDPVEVGFVESLARPGGNVTGIANLTPQLSGKRLELLKEITPALATVAYLWDPTIPGGPVNWRETQTAAPVLGLRVLSVEMSSDAPDFEGAIEAALQRGAQALAMMAGVVNQQFREQIVAQAARHRLPAVYPTRSFVEVGGLMAYATSQLAGYYRAAYYVDRILKGAKPADLPVEQPREFEFVINLRTAQVLGLTIPHHILLQATEVIQ